MKLYDRVFSSILLALLAVWMIVAWNQYRIQPETTDVEINGPVTPEPPKPEPPKSEPPNEALVREGRSIGVKSLKTGTINAILQAAAQEHAEYQARVHVQGHQYWNQRCAKLYQQVTDCGEFAEVVNESWPGQDMEAAAMEMYISWRKSPGHWSAVNGGCDYFGYAMVLSNDGRWFACGIFGVKRQ